MTDVVQSFTHCVPQSEVIQDEEKSCHLNLWCFFADGKHHTGWEIWDFRARTMCHAAPRHWQTFLQFDWDGIRVITHTKWGKSYTHARSEVYMYSCARWLWGCLCVYRMFMHVWADCICSTCMCRSVFLCVCEEADDPAVRLAGGRWCSLWQENPLAWSLLQPHGFNYTADAFMQSKKAPFELQN